MMIRILVIFSFVLLPALVAHAQPEDRPSIDHEIQTFLSAHCVRCHGPKKQEGKVRLDRAGSADGELLRGVRAQLRDGLMPPEFLRRRGRNHTNGCLHTHPAARTLQQRRRVGRGRDAPAAKPP